MKKSLVSNILLTSCLFVWSQFSIANEMDSGQCQLTITKKVIDYGRVARNSIEYQSSGIGKLSPKTEVIRLLCSSEIDPQITIRSLQSLNSNFLFGKKSTIKINLDNFMVDGRVTPTSIKRNGALRNITQLEPDDIILPRTPIKGKAIELVLSITPYITPDESIQPEDILQSDNISLDFANNLSDSFSIISTFNSAACNPTVSGGGVVDYNRIHISHLNPTGPTVLPAKILTLSILCDTYANVAIRADSNRPNSLVDTRGNVNASGAARTNEAVTSAGLGKNLPNGFADISDPDVAGLGLSDNKKIGGYMMVMPLTGIFIDGAQTSVRFITNGKPDKNTLWQRPTSDVTGGSLYSGSYYAAFTSKTNSSIPQSFKNFTASLIIQAYITDRKNLNTNSDILLDGSSTIELYYY